MRTRNRREESPRLARLRVQLIGQQDGRIAAPLCCCRSRRAELTHAARDLRLHIRQCRRQRLVEECRGRGGEMQAVFFHNGVRVRRCRRVGVRGSRGDHVERVAEDVAEHDREHPRGRTMLCKAAALHRAHALSERIHCNDVRARGEQLLREISQLLCGDERLLKERTAAAREQEEHGVLCREVLRQRKCLARGGKRSLVGHGMPRLHAGDARDLAHHMIVFCNHNAAVDALPERIRRRARHLPRRLSNCDEDNPPRAEAMSPECLLHRRIRQNRCNRLLDNPVRIFSQIHDDRPYSIISVL